ncbi:hypothetical protein I3843_14G036800 [Carya illinoinensis]|nr:hypothetical protein I3843_14G036800 [Carya illinoinensis]
MTTSTDKTALPSSSSSSPTRWKYDVFLSFHGEDTRKSFTAHLYTALEQKGIFTFRDDEKLERGQYISLELLKAIKESKYAIIVFSINYAFSNWCLIELAKIAECMKENRLIVFPVFYHVDPSHIRNQKGTFAEAFVKHGEDPNIHIKKIQTWRAALEEVGNIAGWHLHDRDESTAIKEIIETILSQLNRTCLSISGKLFGIDSPVDQMIKNLHRKNSDGVCFVGICGMGGIGKTTLAEVVFNRIRNQFQATSFIDCVREKSIGYHGLISLQKQLLSQILEEEKINIQDVREGMNMIKNRLFSRKVLIILDDVDKEQQLEALTGNHDWFGPGSRIIITSRDRHLLKRHVDYIYMATVLGHANAMQLFCWKAFKNPYPKENYVDLCKDFVEYANGLPLALKVLGSSLYDRGTNEWESARDKLKENPNREVLDILEIGFHSLGVAERKLFLDIACFFKREIKKDLIIDLLESSDYPPHIDVAILVDKSLLTVCDGNSFSMHDLLQEMGKEIVQRESPEVPGRRSRLWLLEDALETLSNNTGTNVVEGIVLNSSFQKEESLSAETFSKMKRLRLLQICYGQLPEDLSYLSNELRLLEWFGYPLKSFPSSFQPDKLVELRMPCSQIKQLWINVTKCLCKLKLIDLSYSQNLYKMPNFNKIPNLEKLILQECTSLSSIHQSIGVLKRLIVLNLRGCKSLANLPENIGSLECLEELDASETAITRIPSSISLLKNLQNLSFHGCKVFFKNCSRLQALPKLPSGIAFVWAENCTSLNIYSNQIYFWCSNRQEAWCSDNIRCGPSWAAEIPKWFDEQSSSSSVRTMMQYPTLNNNEWMGCALFVIYEVHELETSNFRISERSDTTLDLKDLHQFVCDFETNEGCLKQPLVLNIPKGPFVGPTGFWAYIPYVWFLEQSNIPRKIEKKKQSNFRPDNIVASITTGSPGVEVKNLGMRILYDSKDGKELAETIGRSSLGVKHAKNKVYKYIFPLRASPPWFKDHRFGRSIRIPLPANLYDDIRWIGFAVYACFAVKENPSVSRDSKTCRNFSCLLSTDDGCIQSSTIFPLTRNIFRESHRLLVFHIPRLSFTHKLNQQNSIRALFGTSSSDVEAQVCGMRIVYEHQVEGFIRTVVNCILGSPEGYHQGYKRSLVHQVNSDLPRNVLQAESESGNASGRKTSSNSHSDYSPTSQSHIPKSFCSHSGPLLTFRPCRDLYNSSDWCGIAVCAIFTFLKHSTLVHNRLGLEISRGLTCYFGNDVGWTISIHKNNTESEFTESSWLNQCEFLWLLYIPRVSILDKLKPCNLWKALFVSKSQGLMVQKCGHALVYQENVEEFVQVITHCSSTFPNKSQPVHQFSADDCRNTEENYNDEGETRVSTSSSDHRLRRHIYQGESNSTANACKNSDKQIKDATNFLLKNFEGFNELYIYDRCFPPSEIQKLFSHCSAGPRVTIDFPSNFCNAKDIVGLVLCATFSVPDEHPLDQFLENLESQVPHEYGLICALYPDFMCREFSRLYFPTKEELKWISHLREFNWLFYLPRWWLWNRFKSCHRLTASIASNWRPCLVVQKCAVRVLHQKDAQEMFQIVYHSSVSFFDNWNLFHKDIVREEDCIRPMETFSTEIEECDPMDSGSARNARPTSVQNQVSKTNSTILHESNFKSLLLRIFKGFDPFSASNTCLSDTKIPEWFSHHRGGSSATIQLPSNIHGESNWMGLAVCTTFSVQEHLTVSQDKMNSNVSYRLSCQLDTDIGSLDPPHVFPITEEKFSWFYPHGFIWLSYIPCGSVRDLLGQCRQIQASVVSDCPSLMVLDCGLRLLYKQDSEEFEQTIIKCLTSPFSKMNLILQSVEADTGNDMQNNDVCINSCKWQSSDFDRCSVYNSCFPPCEILEWFNHHSNEPSVTFKLPSNLYEDSNWLGLALCASFSVDKDSAAIIENLETSQELICHLETDIGSVEPLHHVYHPTKEDFMLIQLGMFTWLSYIPRGSLPEWLNQCTRIKASIASDCPNLAVQKCGFRLIHLHDEVEFKQTLRHCVASLSDAWDLIRRTRPADSRQGIKRKRKDGH